MNTLSWLIYAADAAASLKTVFGALSIISGILTGLVLVAAGITAAIGEADDDDEARSFSRGAREWGKKGFPIVIACSIFWAVLPTSKTIYMIAASEAGEQIVTSPDAVEMMGDLKAVIKKKLKEELEAQ